MKFGYFDSFSAKSFDRGARYFEKNVKNFLKMQRFYQENKGANSHSPHISLGYAPPPCKSLYHICYFRYPFRRSWAPPKKYTSNPYKLLCVYLAQWGSFEWSAVGVMRDSSYTVQHGFSDNTGHPTFFAWSRQNPIFPMYFTTVYPTFYQGLSDNTGHPTFFCWSQTMFYHG